MGSVFQVPVVMKNPGLDQGFSFVARLQGVPADGRLFWIPQRAASASVFGAEQRMLTQCAACRPHARGPAFPHPTRPFRNRKRPASFLQCHMDPVTTACLGVVKRLVRAGNECIQKGGVRAGNGLARRTANAHCHIDRETPD